MVQTWKWPNLVLATRNDHKLKEFQSIFSDQLGLSVSGMDELECVEDMIEDGETFVDNALIKARTIARYVSVPVLADDSGLSVDALNGDPGVLSARFAGEHGDDKRNNEKLLTEMRAVPTEKRGAKFVCALAMVFPDHMKPIVTTGECYGKIALEARGANGFGYDPLFEVNGTKKTMAELSSSEKNRISHRARAIASLIEELKVRFEFL